MIILLTRRFRSQRLAHRAWSAAGRPSGAGLPAGVTVDSQSAGDASSRQGSWVRPGPVRSPHLLAGLAA